MDAPDPAPLAVAAPIAPAWTSVTLGVADLETAVAFWTGALGFEVVGRRQGPDAELARLWRLAASDIRRQAMVATPGVRTGMLHLVEFTRPSHAVRGNAQAFDEVPKNLDIYVQDLPRRVEALRQAGHRFRNDSYSEITAPDGTVFREIHLPGHDAINIVLLEVPGKSLPFNAAGYAGVGPLIASVCDAQLERTFYRETMGFSLLSENLLQGAEVERMVGLPPGSALDVSIWGSPDALFGQIEVIDYRGVKGENLYPLTVPPQRGILHVSYAVGNLDAFTQRLRQASIAHTLPLESDILPGRGRYIRFRSPAGMNIEAFELHAE